jgi:hypothetical protein
MLIWFFSACGRFDNEVFFISKDGNSTISKSAINCGATTSSYNYEIYANHTIGGIILIQHPTDTTDLDMTIWIRMED